MKTSVAWLSTEQAAEHLGFKTLRAFYRFLETSSRPPRRHYLGRRLRFRQVDLDACVEVALDTNSARPRLRIVNRGR